MAFLSLLFKNNKRRKEKSELKKKIALLKYQGKLLLPVFLFVFTLLTVIYTQTTQSSPDLEAGLVAHWSLSSEDSSGTTIYDISTNTNHGTNSGATFTQDRFGRVNNAMDFGTRSNSYSINFGNDTSLRITNNQTISMWLKPSDLAAGRQNPYNKAYGGEGTITQETDGRLNYYYGTAGGNAHDYQGFSMTDYLENNKWVHVVIVRDLDDMKLRWYKNGNLTNETNANFSQAVASSLDLIIGTGYAGNYSGIIDDVRIYNRALTQEEITLLHEENPYEKYIEDYVIEAFTTIGSHNWTVPEGVSAVDVLVVGGGGGAGRR